MRVSKAYWGKVVEIGQTEEVSCAIIIVEPTKSVKPHYHKKTKEIEYVLAGQATCKGKLLKEGDYVIFEPGQVHDYHNIGNSNFKLLVISIPPFDPKDMFEEKVH